MEEIRASGLKYMVTPMETVLEGSYDEIINVFGKAQQVVLDAGASEIIVTIRLHIRKDSDVSFEEKTANISFNKKLLNLFTHFAVHGPDYG